MCRASLISSCVRSLTVTEESFVPTAFLDFSPNGVDLITDDEESGEHDKEDESDRLLCHVEDIAEIRDGEEDLSDDDILWHLARVRVGVGVTFGLVHILSLLRAGLEDTVSGGDVFARILAECDDISDSHGVDSWAHKNDTPSLYGGLHRARHDDFDVHASHLEERERKKCTHDEHPGKEEEINRLDEEICHERIVVSVYSTLAYP